eukprot:jgi/Tetstr1/425019/TSEL_015487.t1
MTNPRYDRHQRAPAERRVNTNYGHHPRDTYRHQAPPGQPFYNDNRNNQGRPQRQQRWTNQGSNDGMQRHQQPVGFVSPAGHQHPGHQQASDTFTQRPTGHQEAYPFVGVSPSAQHHSSLPIMLTCNTTAPGGADTGAQEGEGKDSAEDDLHDPWHVPYSDSFADFESPFSHSWHVHRSRPHPDAFPIFDAPNTPPRWNVYSHPYSLDPPIHLFDINWQPSEVEALVEYGFTIHKITGADPSPEARTMWHLRLGHRCARHMELTQQHAIGIPKLGSAPEAICPACIQAKSHQQSVNRQPSPRAEAPYMLVVIDDWKGPFRRSLARSMFSARWIPTLE